VSKVIVHVAEVEVSQATGMGRVAYHWRSAFQRRGYEFIHLGPAETGRVMHPTLFPRAAYSAYKRSGKKAGLFLVHEPAAGNFIGRGTPAFVFSHGLERRGAELEIHDPLPASSLARIKRRLTAPLWKRRLSSCDQGLRGATAALLINREDAEYALKYYQLPPEKIWVFRNGVNSVSGGRVRFPETPCQVLFLGSWLKRKGTETLAQAAAILHQRGIRLKWMLAGTGLVRDAVLAQWPTELIGSTVVNPHFAPDQEGKLMAESSIFVLPSFFEGQPLALLEAMAWGCCCITSNCCGQKDLIDDRQTGLFHAPGDAEGLARLIEECAENRELRQRLGRHAAISVEGRTWDVVSDEVVSYVESVMDEIERGRAAPRVSG
jgi:glycosyltransferase involved in cell wall biosynthesis